LLDVVQDTVDTVADLQLVLEGLDVNVAGALFHRSVDQKVHETDDRRLAGEIPQVVDVFLVLADVLEVPVTLDRGGRRSRVFVVLERRQDLFLFPEQRLHVQTGRNFETLDAVGVAWVGHRHRQDAVLYLQRQDLGVA